jgi:TolB-like protein/Tfp pilus assembly protein PilF
MTEPPHQPHGRRLGVFEFQLLTELRRRHVFRVAGAYLGAAWFLVHMGTVLGENFIELHRIMPAVIGVLGAGLPLVLAGAWLFELTPEGFRLTRRVGHRQSIRELTARKLDVIVLVLFALAVVAMLSDRWIFHRAADESAVPVFTLVILALLADRLIGQRLPDGTRRTTKPVPPVELPSIAVLPFVDMSERKDQEYFSDGLSEELISLLTKVSDLRVPARTSCFYFKGRQTTVAEIAKALHVTHLLEGSVRKSGDKIRITTQLIRADNGYHVWAQTYDRKLDDIFEVQDEIASAAVHALKATLLNGALPGRAAALRSSAAYELYLLGRFHWNKRSPEDFRKAIECFRQAIVAEPNYPLAFSGIADCYSLLPIYDSAEKATETMPQAKQAASKALSLDDELAEAHASLGLTLVLFDYDWAGAERHFKRAIELSPNSPSPHQWYCELLVNAGRLEEGLAEGERALQIDPLSLVANLGLGIALNSARRYDEAIHQLQRTLELGPKFADASYFLFEAYANKAIHQEAVEVYARQKQLDGEPAAEIDSMKEAFAKESWDGFLRHRISFLETRPHPVAEEIAAFCARVGENDKAFAWLEKSYEARSARLTHLKVDARYDNLRSDPRFARLLHAIGLT